MLIPFSVIFLSVFVFVLFLVVVIVFCFLLYILSVCAENLHVFRIAPFDPSGRSF